MRSASRPTGTVMFWSGSPNFGKSAKKREKNEQRKKKEMLNKSSLNV